MFLNNFVPDLFSGLLGIDGVVDLVLILQPLEPFRKDVHIPDHVTLRLHVGELYFLKTFDLRR